MRVLLCVHRQTREDQKSKDKAKAAARAEQLYISPPTTTTPFLRALHSPAGSAALASCGVRV
eukprot:3855224-Rhodomonas_salina.1